MNSNWIKKGILRILKLFNIVLMAASFGAIWYQFLDDLVYKIPYFNKGNWFIILLFGFIYSIFAHIYDALLVSYSKVSQIVYSQMLSAFLSDFFIYIICWLIIRAFPPIFPFIILICIQFIVSVFWSNLSRLYYYKAFKPKKSIVVWDVRKDLINLIQDYNMEDKFKVVGSYSVKECTDNLSLLDKAEVVFLAGVHSHDRNSIIKYCTNHNITAFVIPTIGDVLMSAAHRIHIFHLPIMRLERYNPTPEFLLVKRLFDILISALALVLLSPVFLLVAFLIKKEDNGPVFYKQKRLTKDGKVFELIKFRSMKTNAENDGVARLSTGENDDRITKIGRKIRKLRIDELPQFINIISGSMSIVGPRPERPEIATEYEKNLPEFSLRLQAKAGLTGYAQVYGKYNTTPYDKLQLDLMYIANPSLIQDVSILFATVKILFMKESTEGIAEGQTTAANLQNNGEGESDHEE